MCLGYLAGLALCATLALARRRVDYVGALIFIGTVWQGYKLFKIACTLKGDQLAVLGHAGHQSQTSNVQVLPTVTTTDIRAEQSVSSNIMRLEDLTKFLSKVAAATTSTQPLQSSYTPQPTETIVDQGSRKHLNGLHLSKLTALEEERRSLLAYQDEEDYALHQAEVERDEAAKKYNQGFGKEYEAKWRDARSKWNELEDVKKRKELRLHRIRLDVKRLEQKRA